MADVVEVLVSGGKATAGPPIGPALGPLGINVKAIVDEINKKTAEFNGMQVPVRIEVDDKKNFTSPWEFRPRQLSSKEVHIEKGSRTQPESGWRLADAGRGQNRPDESRRHALYDLKNAVKEVVGTCVSMGVNVEGKRPKEILAAIDAGTYDSVLAQ